MKSFLKGLVVDVLIVCIPCAFAVGLVCGYRAESMGTYNKLGEIVGRVRPVPEYETVEVWYEVPSKGVWLGLLEVDVLSGTIKEVKEPMKGYWKGERRIKAVGKRFGGGVDEIQLCQNIKSGGER